MPPPAALPTPADFNTRTNALRTRARVLLTTLFLGFLALNACQTAAPPGTAPPVAQASVANAERAESAGEHVIAAREYERLADASPSPQAHDYLLKAIESLIKAGELSQARVRLAFLNNASISPTLVARQRILEARLELAEGAHKSAIERLNEAAATRNLSPELLSDIYRARAQAELSLDNPIAAASNLVAREQYLVGKNTIAENQLELWNILQSLTRAQLRSELNLTADMVLAGWLALAQIHAENAGNSLALGTAIAQWRTIYPDHPAGAAIIERLASAAPVLTGRIERIALLLPLTSNYAVSAQAVRDGFMAMHAAGSDADKPTVTVYDIGADPLQAPAYYERAVRERAQIVVGPLGREATDALIRANRLAVPTLLLSHTDERPGSAARLFQFGLPPEQEARQAAERAYLDGCRQAALLYPESAWGQRLMAAFNDHWQRLGGVVLASGAYRENEVDYSEPIKRLLNINESEARETLLEKKLGQKLQFETRARQDIECIFLAADAKRGRLIKPQLNYHHARQVPVYSTSHIFTGKADPVQDTDLDGVLFGDMPWMLASSGRVGELRSLQRDWPHVHSDLDRLYALGMDAYAILPHLNRIGAENAARFNGVTSALSLDQEGRLHRQLSWARFRNGVPRLLDGR